MNLSVHLIFILSSAAVTTPAFTNRWVPPLPDKAPGVPEAPEPRIVGGHEAEPHSHPYLVSLQLRFLWVRVHLCGGTLLNEYWVLTAGHCILESWLLRWLPMDVIAGAHDVDRFGPQTQVITVERRVTHPLYDGGVGPHDIALLRVKMPFVFNKQVQSVNLPINYKISPQPMILSGWGVLRTTVFFPALPGKLQEVEVTYVPYKECYEALEDVKDEGEDNPLDKDANICTGPLTGGIAACNGDSGGPLVQVASKKAIDFNDPTEEATDKRTTEKGTTEGGAVENSPTERNATEISISDKDKNGLDIIDDNHYDYNEETNDIERKESNKPVNRQNEVPVIVGVVSWGAMPCGEKGAPTVYTKVSNYLDFINQYIDT